MKRIKLDLDSGYITYTGIQKKKKKKVHSNTNRHGNYLLVCQKYMVDQARVNMQWVITYTVLYAQYSFSIPEKQTETRCGHE